MTDQNNDKALLILNPNSGVQPVTFIVTKELDRKKDAIDTFKSFSIKDTQIIIDDNRGKYDIFVAGGGDGTVHTVASEIVGTDKILAVMPLGSGNGFAREFGFTINVWQLASDIAKKETMEIDTIEINDHLCLNVAGIGLDSFVAHSFNDMKLRGFLPYIWLTLKTFLILRPFDVKISFDDGQTITEKIFVITMANTRQFGNNAFIAPSARPNDGMIDLVLIKPFPKIFGPLFIIRLFTKRINRSRYVKVIKTDRSFTIETEETRLHIDGEPVTFNGKVNVKLKRNALKVLMTKRNKFI